MKPPSQHDFTDLALHAGQITGQLPALHAELRARWLVAKKDGWPSSSLSEGGRTSHEIDPITGESIPLPTYSDPTGTAATEAPDRDADAITLINAHRLLKDADALLRSAHGLFLKALRPPTEVADEDHPDDPGCRSCRRRRRPGDQTQRVYEESFRDGLCHFCYGWFTDCGQLPAMDVLKDRHEGKRIAANRMPPRQEQTA